jgi:glycosyltransferase involved in cell wall biosynthesis
VNTTPLMTVLINNYNYGRYIGQAIDSALNQSYPNVEIIVVDDGSTDDSRDVIRRYEGSVRGIFKDNGGQASAFNAGIASANGEWICFLDSDDYWTKDKVQVVVDAIRSAPEARLVYDSVQPVDSQGTPHGKVIPHIYYEGDISGKLQRTGGWWPAPPTSALTLHTDLLRRLGPVPEAQFRLCADAYLFYLIPLLAKVTGTTQIGTMYRFHATNGFSNASRFQNERGALEASLVRYEGVLSAVNERLFALGSNRNLRLTRHWPYQRLRYQLNKPDKPSLLQLLRGIALWPDSHLTLLNQLWKSVRARSRES